MKKNVIKLNEASLKKIVAESVKRTLKEISSNLLDRAASKAHTDMMQNWNDSSVREKRKNQWQNLTHACINRSQEEKDSICPSVPESELKNMPKGTYVIMDGNGRDAYANFTSRYSGRAGTKEQCLAFVNKYYDKYTDWEFSPSIVPIEDYFKYHRKH